MRIRSSNYLLTQAHSRYEVHSMYSIDGAAVLSLFHQYSAMTLTSTSLYHNDFEKSIVQNEVHTCSNCFIDLDCSCACLPSHQGRYHSRPSSWLKRHLWRRGYRQRCHSLQRRSPHWPRQSLFDVSSQFCFKISPKDFGHLLYNVQRYTSLTPLAVRMR